MMNKKAQDFGSFVILVVVLIMAILAIIIFGSFYTIGAGERGIVNTFGKPAQVATTEGFHFKIPLAQTVVVMDTKTQKYETHAGAASKDLQTVSADITVNYHLSDDSVVELYKTIGVNFEDKIIQPAVQEVVKAATSQYTAEELITKRPLVKDAIDLHLRERLDSKGILVQDILITNFDFSESFNAAIENKVKAEQDALAAKNKLAQVEFEAQQRITQANAEAQAIQIQAQAVNAQGGEDYVNLQWIQKWNGQTPNVIMGSNANPLITIPTGASP